jgi:hypothetical protein
MAWSSEALCFHVSATHREVGTLAGIDRLAPPLIIMSGLGVTGFVMSLGWSKIVVGGLDRDKVVFLAKMWGGIALAGIVLVFVALS